MPVVGVLVQAVVGGITVLVDLHPAIVGGHLLISMALVAFSTWLVVRTREGDGPAVPLVDRTHPDPRPRARAPSTAVVLALGVVVTGAGPHSGDDEVGYRFDVDPLLDGEGARGVGVGVRRRARRGARPAAPPRRVTGRPWTAGAGAARASRSPRARIGYVQVATGLPIALVNLHMLGAALLTAAVTFFVGSLRTRDACRPFRPDMDLVRVSEVTPSLGPMADAITAQGLVKRYKTVTALDGVDLDRARPAPCSACSAPTVPARPPSSASSPRSCSPTRARATVAGVDVLARPRDVRRRIGLSGQYAAVDEYLTGFENLDMIGRLYHLGAKRSRARARELLASFRLEDAADRPSKTYSGGMRRRLDLAGALVADPPIIFLDEPTTGLDPRGRTEMWEVIQNLVAGGTTLLLTTQYLEEADLLADEIVVIDHGRIIAQGTADQLKTPGRR